MSSLGIYVLLWITFIHDQECTVIRFDHNRRVKDGIDYLLHKYLDPLRVLTAQLPNHAIEMQIEINEPTYKPQKKVVRILNSRHPKKGLVKRSQDVAVSAATDTAVTETVTSSTASTKSEVVPPAAIAAILTVTPPPSVPPTTATATTAATAATAAPVPVSRVDPGKMPVYKEDLNKALEELEKRLSSHPDSTTTLTTRGGDTPCTGGNGGGGGGGGANAVQTQVRSIEDIVQLLKKAIHIEHQMPRPSDDNLEWVQLKIPKNI